METQPATAAWFEQEEAQAQRAVEAGEQQLREARAGLATAQRELEGAILANAADELLGGYLASVTEALTQVAGLAATVAQRERDRAAAAHTALLMRFVEKRRAAGSTA